MAEISITSLGGYREHLINNPGEWNYLRHCCRVTISRFYRDRAVFNALRWKVIPDLHKHDPKTHTLLAWSCGCASGEEPYTLCMISEQLGRGRLPLEIVATDVDQKLLERAEAGFFGASSLRELPSVWKDRYFDLQEDQYQIAGRLKTPITWLQQDVLEKMPKGPFDLVLCRYLVFTYFDLDLQAEVLSQIASSMKPGGALVLGQMEELPPTEDFAPRIESLKIFRRTASN